MHSRTKEIIALSAIIGAGLFFSLFHIKESPPVWYDEGIYTQAARNLAEAGIVGFQYAPDELSLVPQLSVGYPLIFPLAAVYKVFGAGVLQGRLLMVLFIMGLIVISYALIRMTFGVKAALLGAALLAFFPPLYGTGKSVLGEVPGTFYFILSLVFLTHALMSSADGRRTLRIVGAGLCAGLAVVTKPVFIVILPALLIVAVLYRKGLKTHRKEFVIGVGALSLPIIIWALVQFGPDSSIREVVQFYSNPSNVGDVWGTVFSNMRKFFTDLGPLTLLVTMVAWLAALCIRLYRHASIGAAETAAFIFCAISLLAFLRTAGYYRYLFPYQAISLLYFPAALSVIVGEVGAGARVGGISGFVRMSGFIKQYLVLGISALLVLFGTYQLFFNSWVADAYANDRTASWERYFASDEIKRPVFYYDVPEVAFFDRDKRHFQYINMAPAAGISVGKPLTALILIGIPETVIVETAVLKDEAALFQKYRAVEEVDKYTILERLSS